MSNEHNPIERAVDLFVFAPIGVAMFAKDTVPTFLKMFVARGQTELAERKKSLHDHANQYRAVGQLAVKYGGPVVKRQAEGKIDGVLRRAEETLSGLVVGRTGGGEQPAPEPRIETSSTSITKPPPANGATSGASADTNGNGTKGVSAAPESAPIEAPTPHVEPSLAIPGYDQLSASHVVERLDGLTPGELDAVRDYEIAHRGRSTILGKITQLTS